MEVRMRRGVYFLANDRIYEQAVAFLNSFRLHNPTIPLCLVPFAADSGRVRALAARYHFSVLGDCAVLDACDRIGAAFHNGDIAGQYRKLAMWCGPYDEFLYIDSDTVVLEPVDFVFDHLDGYGFLTSHSDMPHIRQWVWHESIYASGALTREQIDFAANTGFVASRRGLLDPREVERGLAAPLALRPHMQLLCSEQPLLNYLIVTSGHAYSSLFVDARSSGDTTIPLERWAGDDLGPVVSGRLPAPPAAPNPVLLVHWAGFWQSVRDTGGVVPYHDLWRHYRYLADPGRPAAAATAGIAEASVASTARFA
jgi:hypothetical protein